MKTFKRLLPMIIILLFEIAVGIMMLINGALLFHIIFWVFGILLLIGGIITLIRAIVVGRKEETAAVGTWALISAIIMIGIGGFFIAIGANPDPFLAFIAVIFGIIMAINGMFKVAEYASIRKSGTVNGFVIVGAIITIILGIIIAFNPFGPELMYLIFGIMILVSAVLDVISLIIFAKAMKEYEDQLIQK